MNAHLDCTEAREHVSARLDGERADAAGLDAHLAACAECREHAAALAGLARELAVLRAPRALPDLWPAIERRLNRRTRPLMWTRPALRNAAAALIGFAGIGAAALAIERERERERLSASVHVLERLAASHASPHALFAELPEYRLLRLAPTLEESR